MTQIDFVDNAIDTEEIGERLLGGALLVWRQLPALQDLVAVARTKLQEGFGGDPLTAEARFDPESYLKTVRRLRAAFRTDAEINALFKRAMIEVGLAADDCYWDPLQLRVVPAQSSHHGRRIMPLPAHRDNWGSNIPQQLNWWTPIHPVSAGRTILFYPSYFDRPIANSSADWDFDVLKRLMEEGKAEQYPVLPALTVPTPDDDAMPVVVEPGDMLAFSGQHLHGSIASDVSAPRFSIEARSVNLSHIRAGLKAPNPDGRAPRVVPDWFEHVVSGEKLAL